MANTILDRDIGSKKIIREKAFAKRLETACESHPHCPTDQYRGKQKWIYEGLEREFGLKVSAEAVRKWFAGESRPRPKVMSFLARLLEVDEAWLALGILPELTPQEKKQRSAVASGAVNLVAGMIQMAGGNIAFPEEGDDEAEIYAIIGGKQYRIDVVIPLEKGRGEHLLRIRNKLDRKHVLVVTREHDFYFRVLAIPASVVLTQGQQRGDFWELTLEQRGINWKAGEAQVLDLKDIREIADA